MRIHRRPTLLVRLAAGVGLAAAVALAAVPVALADQFLRISDSGFSAPSITVHLGETVSWTNTGSVPHSVTADDGSFDSGPIDPGSQYANVFTELGTFNYHSSSDPSFHGQVIVLSIDNTATSSARPTTPATQALGGPIATRPAGASGIPPDDSTPVLIAALVTIAAATAVVLVLARRRSPDSAGMRRRSGPRR